MVRKSFRQSVRTNLAKHLVTPTALRTLAWSFTTALPLTRFRRSRQQNRNAWKVANRTYALVIAGRRLQLSRHQISRCLRSEPPTLMILRDIYCASTVLVEKLTIAGDGKTSVPDVTGSSLIKGRFAVPRDLLLYNCLSSKVYPEIILTGIRPLCMANVVPRY